MINVKLILCISLVSVFVCGACSSNLTGEAQNDRFCETTPSARVAEYQTKLLRSDFVGVNRLYSKRVLHMKLNNREPKGCKKAEDCLTAAHRIAGFEVAIAGGESKTLKETPTSDADRIRVETVPPAPLSVGIIYELIREDGDWYVDKVFYENGELIAGFEDAPKTELTIGGVKTVPK